MLIGPFGRSEDHDVHILGSFLWYYRIEAIQITPLKGQRFLMPGERAWVPKRAVSVLGPADVTSSVP